MQACAYQAAFREEFMMKEQCRSVATATLFWSVLILAAVGSDTGLLAEGRIDSQNMDWIGHNDLQGRPAYEPTVIQQGNRFILYVGHHQGSARNPLTGVVEPNGTSI